LASETAFELQEYQRCLGYYLPERAAPDERIALVRSMFMKAIGKESDHRQQLAGARGTTIRPTRSTTKLVIAVVSYARGRTPVRRIGKGSIHEVPHGQQQIEMCCTAFCEEANKNTKRRREKFASRLLRIQPNEGDLATF
jgi:hypothetical protein